MPKPYGKRSHEAAKRCKKRNPMPIRGLARCTDEVLPRVSTYGTSPDEKSSQGGHPRREQIQEAKSEAYGPAVRLEQKINEKQATLAMGGYNVRGRGAIEAFFTKRIIATLLICTRSGLSENEIWSAKELFSSLLRSFQSILHR